MAVISTDIYLLIQRMNRTEKAYFKKFTYKYEKGEKVEFGLFDLIEKELTKSSVFDEKFENTITRQFSKRNDIKSFSKIKSNLYHDLLYSLREYEKNKHADEKVFEYYQFANVLIKKGMYKESISLLNKAEKLCDENEFFEIKILVNQTQAFAYSRIISSKKGDDAIENLFNAKKTVKNLEELLNHQAEYFQFAFLQKEKGTIREKDEIENIENQKTIIEQQTTQSNRAELYKLETLSTISLLRSNQQESFEYYKKNY